MRQVQIEKSSCVCLKCTSAGSLHILSSHDRSKCLRCFGSHCRIMQKSRPRQLIAGAAATMQAAKKICLFMVKWQTRTVSKASAKQAQTRHLLQGLITPKRSHTLHGQTALQNVTSSSRCGMLLNMCHRPPFDSTAIASMLYCCCSLYLQM